MDHGTVGKAVQAFTLGGLWLLSACSTATPENNKTWEVYGGSKASIRYSSLAQVDTSNVNKLKIAWVYHTGDADTINHSQIQCNPIIVKGILYGVSPTLKVFAADAATGKSIWTFNPRDSNQNKSASDFIMNNCRGVTYWSAGNDKRLFFAAGAILYAIDANTGKPLPSFGKNGKIDLHEGLGPDAKNRYVAVTSPGIIYKELIIMGSRVSEGSDAAPGHIRAYDARSGEQRWIFHTIPGPGEEGYDSWEDPNAWKHIGGANCWSGFSLDEKRGILFAPTGSASFDFYGGRRKGAGLYADCLLALDAGTGRRIWHFQDVHHDVWDKDLPTAPALVTVMHNGKMTDAVAQPTKTGFVFLFDRVTGQPLFPIIETPVPVNTELAGEKLWPTQPIPSLPKPFVRQRFTEADINDGLPDSSYQDIRNKLASYKTGNMFNAPTKQGTVIFPGFDGGAEWGGPAFDPSTGLLYVNANEMPNLLNMVELRQGAREKESLPEAGKRLYLQNCMTCHGPDRKGSGNYPSLLQADKKYNESRFTDLIGTGRRMMPAFKQLTDEERKALASFILQLPPSKDHTRFVAPAAEKDTFRELPYSMTGYNKFLSKEGYPAIKPPWGTLNAIDLNTGEIAWKIPLGTYPELAKKGIITGSENYGGPVVTAGGLVFIAATKDAKFRAFNKRTGQLLWETDLPAPGFATPAVYEVNGRQFIVIACGGGKLHSHSGDSYVAFALRE